MADEHTTDRPPGDLERLQLFVNTVSFDRGVDDFADPADMTTWLRAHGLAAPSDAFDAADVKRVIAFREALRSLLLTHHGEEVDRDAVDALASAGGDVPLVVTFGPDGATRLEPALDGVPGVLGRLLAIIARSEAEGTWARMKACPMDDCRWAFYDHSRNRSRTWCDMTVCGNRAKARTYRRRAARRGEA